jgi:hypothetical protein
LVDFKQEAQPSLQAGVDLYLGPLGWSRFPMKITKTVLCIAAVVGLFAASATASNGRVSDRSLAKMGLSGMKSLSDEQGSRIRGAGHDKFSGFPNPIRFINELAKLLEHHHRK